ncbi:MAG: NAD(P)/FAD-dependent oxidoreductase [bacterium]
MKKQNIYIIGGGAAGLVAALSAASGAVEAGGSVTVLEKTDRPGRKLAITGKGRCNITTGHDIETAIAEFGPNGRFLRSAFSRFFRDELLELLESLGIPVVKERGERYFPLSGRAGDVVDALIKRLGESGVEIVTNCRVKKIKVEDGKVSGVTTTKGDFSARKVILATGGASYPATGSTGDGYKIAAALGHTIIKPLPALVPIELEGDVHTALDGLSLKNVRLTLLIGNEVLGEEFGDALFTPFGITGPAALSLGKQVAMNAGDKLILTINFKPALTAEQVDRRLTREFEANIRKSLKNILPNLLPKRAAEVFVKISEIPGDKKGGQITKSERERLAGLLTGLRFGVKGARPISEAIVTAGGVDLAEVNPRTMESKIVKGLYICGEVLDLDAGTGGFNLQSAFSTGFVAGGSAV